MRNAIIVLFVFSLLINSVQGFEDWTNITCVNDSAVKIFESTINDELQERNETEICNGLACVDGVGCIDPRETPGEIFLGQIFIFMIAAFLFGYLAIKIDNPNHAPIRMFFFMICLIFIVSGTWISYFVALQTGQLLIAQAVFPSFIGTFFVFFFMLLYTLKQFVVWMATSLKLKNKKEDAEDLDVI